MTISLTENLKSELEQTAHHCSIPPEKLASLFVEDGIRSYARDRQLASLFEAAGVSEYPNESDALRDSIDREDI
jgi:hypothetical protein